MRFVSEISEEISASIAAQEVCQRIEPHLAGKMCDLVCVFVSTSYQADWPAVLSLIQDRLHPRVLIGCSGSGVIGGGRECEWIPALGIMAAVLPSVRLFPFTMGPDELELSSPGGFWVDKIGPSPQSRPVLMLFADPYTCDPNKLIHELNQTYPGCPIIGGLVSGGHGPGQHWLFSGCEVSREGALGVAMTGNIVMDPIVSQACRPVGRPYVVTQAQENVVVQLGGRQAISVLHEVLSSLSLDDRELAQKDSVFTGLVVNEVRHAYAPGDFLIRHIVGIDPDAGAIAIAERVQVGQTLQFHIRDAVTSRQELRRRLAQLMTQRSGPLPPYSGGLLFNCTGRGKAFYGASHNDVRTIQAISGNLPIGGIFSNGEIGPIGRTNFLHGYTASLGLFRPREPL